MKKLIKLFLLTGFLGAGKTTLLKKLISHLKEHKIGIIMNEFGSISIDGILLRDQGMEVHEINNGSVFCSCLKGEFVDSLITYSQLPIEYLFVESSGMADPSNIKSLLEEVIGKSAGISYDYRGAICIVDANNFLDQLEVLLPIERQVKTSNYLVLNKMDMVSADMVKQVTNKLIALNSNAQIIESSYCDISLDFIDSNVTDVLADFPGAQSCSINTPSNRPVGHIIKLKGIFEEDKIRMFIDGIIPCMIRIKGFFHFNTGWKQIDVSGNHIEIKNTNIRPEMSEMVLISTKGLPALREIYTQWGKYFDIELELT